MNDSENDSSPKKRHIVRRLLSNEYVNGSLFVALFLLLFAAIFAFGVESDTMSFADAFYFCTVVFTLVGYG